MTGATAGEDFDVGRWMFDVPRRFRHAQPGPVISGRTVAFANASNKRPDMMLKFFLAFSD